MSNQKPKQEKPVQVKPGLVFPILEHPELEKSDQLNTNISKKRKNKILIHPILSRFLRKSRGKDRGGWDELEDIGSS